MQSSTCFLDRGRGEERRISCELKRGLYGRHSSAKPFFWDDCDLCCRYSSAKSFLFGMIATFFPVFDVPVFWPILLLYFFVLFFITMKRQIKHMIKHKYIPFDLGKKVIPPQLSENSLLHVPCDFSKMLPVSARKYVFSIGF